MTATELLREQHEQAQTLIEELADADVDERESILSELARVLRGHTAIEEELLYPLLQRMPAFSAMMKESIAEHEQIKTSLSDLERCAPADESFSDLVRQLEADVSGHVKDEESDLFPRLEREWTTDTLEQLGTDLQRRFEQLVPEEGVWA